MSDKIEIKIGKDYLERPVMDLVNLLEKKIKEKYPGYTLAWLEGNTEREVVEEELEKIGASDAKVVELDVNILPYRHLGVIIPEGQPLLA